MAIDKTLETTDNLIGQAFPDTLQRINRYSPKNPYGHPPFLNAYYNSLRQTAEFLVTGQGIRFVIKQTVLHALNNRNALFWNPASLASSMVLHIPHSLDVLFGRTFTDTLARNPGDAKPVASMFSGGRWGNVEQILGPAGAVSPRIQGGQRRNPVEGIIGAALGMTDSPSQPRIAVDKASEQLNVNTKDERYPAYSKNYLIAINRDKVVLGDRAFYGENPSAQNVCKRKIVRRRKIQKLAEQEDNNRNIIEIHSRLRHADPIRVKGPYTVEPNAENQEEINIESQQLVNFFLTTIEPGDNSVYSRCDFRAYIKELSESINPSWNEIEAYGRSEKPSTYSNTARSVGLSFMMVAEHPDELLPMYQRLNWLVQRCYPGYSVFEQGMFMNRPPLFRITIGNLYRSVVARFDSLSFNFLENELWEVEKGKAVPRVITINAPFTILHTEVPNRDTNFYAGMISSMEVS